MTDPGHQDPAQEANPGSSPTEDEPAVLPSQVDPVDEEPSIPSADDGTGSVVPSP